jgi:ornithine carbamoyltransferase/carbamoyltransferase
VATTENSGRGPHLGLISLRDWSGADIAEAVRLGVGFFEGGSAGRPLEGRCVGIWFQMTSTRTRTAFTVATARLGGMPVAYGPHDLQTNTGETMADTAQVLGSMLDALVVRTPDRLDDLARFRSLAGLPVVNAMAAEEHPTQGLCDLATLTLHLGNLADRQILYVGEGNNSAVALVLAAARTPGLRVRLVTPPGYGVDADLVSTENARAVQHGGSITQDTLIEEVDAGVDAVYTTRWQTTGTTKADPDWRQVFEPYRVDDALMARMPSAIFLHDLPAHRGDEVTASVLDGPRSVAWSQARMKLFSAMAVLSMTAARSR